MHEPHVLATSTGAELALRGWRATNPRGVVQINHDLGEHAGRYEAFGRFLAGCGFHAYAHDHRGHGGTRAPDTPRGGFGGLARLETDLFDLHEFIAAEHPGLPVIVFGQGAGALIAFRFLIGHAPRLAGAALWNMPAASDYPVRFLSAMLRWERFRFGSDVPSPTMRRIVAGWSGKAFDRVIEDPAPVNDHAYVADRIEPTIAAWLDVLQLTRQAGSPRFWKGLPRDLPLHIAAGGADPVTDRGRMVDSLEQLLKKSGFANVASRRYADQRHDLVNNRNHDVIWREFVQWLEALVGPTASP